MNENAARLTSRSRFLRWLTDPGRSVSEAIRPVLLAQLLSSPGAIVMGALSGLIIALACLMRDEATVFLVLAIIECIVFVMRLAILSHLKRTRSAGRVPSADAAIGMSIVWCALQGATAFFAMRTGDPVLMVLSATMLMGLIGPLCARNFAAPRLALLLVCLCLLPFNAGAIATGISWFFILVFLAPFFLFGAMQIVSNYKAAMVRALTAELANLDQARRDSLTDLLNRAGLDAELAEICDTDQIAIVAMDLDGFKEINDTHGHAAGDAVLEDVAARMRSIIRGDDMLARLGGDEFLLVLPDRETHCVKAIADRLLSTICDEAYRLPDGSSVHVGVSIGYACLPEDTKSVSRLRDFADRALYAAKEAGKGVSARYGQRLAA